MDPHRVGRGMCHRGDGDLYREQRYTMHGSDSRRTIRPSPVPSLSTGQGFYTVESLEGATVVPPLQPAPPPPRIMSTHPPFDKASPFPPRHPPLRPPHIGHLGPRAMRPPPFLRDSRGPPFRHGQEFFVRPGHIRAPVRVLGARRGPQYAHTSDPGFKWTKKRKANSDQEPGWCDVCKIRCYHSLEQHLSGKRHKKQLEGKDATEEQREVTEGTTIGGHDATNQDRTEEAIGDTEMGGLGEEAEKPEKADLKKETELGCEETGNLDKSEVLVDEKAESSLEKEVGKADESDLPTAENDVDKATRAGEDVGKIKAAEKGTGNAAGEVEKGIEEVVGRTVNELNQAVEKSPNQGVTGHPKSIMEENSAEDAGSMRSSSLSVGGKKGTKKAADSNKKQQVKNASNSPAKKGKSKGGLSLTETIDLANGKAGKSAEVQ